MKKICDIHYSSLHLICHFSTLIVENGKVKSPEAFDCGPAWSDCRVAFGWIVERKDFSNVKYIGKLLFNYDAYV